MMDNENISQQTPFVKNDLKVSNIFIALMKLFYLFFQISFRENLQDVSFILQRYLQNRKGRAITRAGATILVKICDSKL